MDCERIREQLGAYLDDEVSKDARREVEAHLNACPECTTELDSLERVAEGLAPQEPVAVPDTLWSAIEQRLDGDIEHKTERVPRRSEVPLLSEAPPASRQSTIGTTANSLRPSSIRQCSRRVLARRRAVPALSVSTAVIPSR